MDKKNFLVGWVAAGVLSTAVVALPQPAEANSYDRYNYDRYNRYSYSRPWERRSDWHELQRERAELRRDWAELERDRTDLRRMYQNGASRAAIERKKEEIRRDWRDIRESQREIRENYADLQRDRYDDRYNYGRGYSSPWWGWGNGWWYRR